MNKTEKLLKDFKLKAPAPYLKTSIVKNAESHWREIEANFIPSGLIKAVKLVLYSSAVSIFLMLSLAFFSSPVQTDENNSKSQEIDLLVDIGLSKKTANLILSLNKPRKFPNHLRQTLIEEI
jgi:hypothetical protein